MPRDMRGFGLFDDQTITLLVLLCLIAIATSADEPPADASANDADGLPPADGASLELANSDFPGLKVELLGSGLGANGQGIPNAGTVTHVQITEISSGKVSTLELFIPVLAADLVDAFNAGSGPLNSINYNEFYQLMYASNYFGTGSGQADTFDGIIGTGSHDDEITGKSGNDTLMINDGNDFFNGGKGSDTADASWLKVKINADLSQKQITHANGTTTLISVENVIGSNKNDTIIGNGQKNKLDGGRGDDVIKGKGGNDIIKGGKGDDTIFGQGGRDVLVFGKKQGKDLVRGFEADKDKINLKAFNYANKAEALSHFKDMGGADNNRFKFMDGNTEAVFKGADLSDIGGTNLLI